MLKDWQTFEDEDGTLVPIEFSNLPFKPQRIFYVANVPKGEERGLHAHYKTQQILTCIKGQILVRVHDGVSLTEHTLNPNESIFIDKLTWDSQVFLTGDDILLSICSTSYNKEDYIEDFNTFLKVTGE
jgi:dTDP-4-dehydrorhamnose 3,5-epimerase-like enzyme